MAQVTYDVTYTEARNRLTNAFRIILALPHAFLVSLWGQVVQLVSVIQWFIILFTGQRNRSLYDFQNQYLGYASRVYSYEAMLFDPYPKFLNDPTGVPTLFAHQYEDQPNRLTNGLRLIWAIPALLLTLVIAIGVVFVCIAQWFVILFTGKANRGMWEFTKRGLHLGLQTSAYLNLMTDTYPKY